MSSSRAKGLKVLRSICKNLNGQPKNVSEGGLSIFKSRCGKVKVSMCTDRYNTLAKHFVSPYRCLMYYLLTDTTKAINPYPTAFPYGKGMVLHFYQQQESSTTKTVHKVINKRLKAYVLSPHTGENFH